MNLESIGHPKKALYAVSKSVTSNCMFFVRKFFPSPNGYGKEDLADGGCYCPKNYAMEGSLTGTQQGSR
jgi:hypothetical protein